MSNGHIYILYSNMVIGTLAIDVTFQYQMKTA